MQMVGHENKTPDNPTIDLSGLAPNVLEAVK